jgi:hypothetical protein
MQLSYRNIDKDKCIITGIGNCTDKYLIIPDEIDGRIVAAIDNCAFRYDHQLISVTIPPTVVQVGSSAFYGCKNLKELIVPEELYVVKEHAFACCQKLENIIFSRIGQLDWFANDIFYGSNNIKSIKIVSK